MFSRVLLVLLLAAVPVMAQGCTLWGRGFGRSDHAMVAQRWGIRVMGLRLTEEGRVCGFSFMVLDAAKAAPLLSRKSPASLINEDGMMTFVPARQKGGQRRSMFNHAMPVEGRTYFIFFANPGKLIKPGTLATVSIGEFVLPGLEVQ